MEDYKEERQLEVLRRKSRLRVSGGGTQNSGLAGAGSSRRMDLGEEWKYQGCNGWADAPNWLTFDP